MKNKLTNIIAAIMLFVSLNAFASDSVTLTVTTASTSMVYTNSARVQAITIANTAASANTVTFYDAPSTVLTNIVGAYTNYVQFATNIVSVYVTPSGISQTNTVAGIYTAAQAVAQSTNNYSTLGSFAVPANTTITFSPVSGWLAAFGVAMANTTNATVTVTYSPAK